MRNGPIYWSSRGRIRSGGCEGDAVRLPLVSRFAGGPGASNLRRKQSRCRAPYCPHQSNPGQPWYLEFSAAFRSTLNSGCAGANHGLRGKPQLHSSAVLNAEALETSPRETIAIDRWVSCRDRFRCASSRITFTDRPAARLASALWRDQCGRRGTRKPSSQCHRNDRPIDTPQFHHGGPSTGAWPEADCIGG